jgi:hypothetical protein
VDLKLAPVALDELGERRLVPALLNLAQAHGAAACHGMVILQLRHREGVHVIAGLPGLSNLLTSATNPGSPRAAGRWATSS